jgi:outer membrane protein assembly factor BamB
MKRLFLSIASATLFVALPDAQAADWPEYRGPTAQGLVTEVALPTEWSDVKNVVWKQPIPGKGWSSPVVASGRIYLTTAVPVEGGEAGELSLQALCLDGETGKPLWLKEVFREEPSAPKPHSKNSHASPTPLVRDGRLYVHFGHMGTACLDLDGNIQWRNNDIHYAPVHGNGGTPILVDDALIFSCDGTDLRCVVALDRRDGHLLWKKDRAVHATKGFSFGTPLVITVGGHKQVVSEGSNVVGAYDPKTGEEIWQVRFEGYSVVPRPVFGNGMVYLSTGFDSPKILAIRPDGTGDVTDTHVAWTWSKNAPSSPSPLLLGEELYTVSDGGILTCLDAKKGTEYWHERVAGAYTASPIAADGKIYLLSEAGLGVVVQANKDKFQLAAKNPINEKTLASYGVIDGDLLIRTESNLYRIKAK